MTITVVAMLVISEVEIDQVAFRGRLDAFLFDQLPDDDPAGDLAGDDHGEARPRSGRSRRRARSPSVRRRER